MNDMSELYQIILDKAVSAANNVFINSDESHTENLYSLSVLLITDGRPKFIRWLKRQHPTMLDGNILKLPLQHKDHMHTRHVAAESVFNQAGITFIIHMDTI